VPLLRADLLGRVIAVAHHERLERIIPRRRRR
jgi:hypothetical protein